MFGPGPPQYVLDRQVAKTAAEKAKAVEEELKALAKAEADRKAKADAQAKAVAEAKAKANEEARQKFNKTHDNIDDNYFLAMIKNIGWKLNNLFTPADKTDIMRSVLISDSDADLLTTTGATKDKADERNGGMWMALNKSITGKDGITTEHYFEKIYEKLACCSGKSQITVPILKRNTTTGKIERIYKTIKVDRTKECTINGQDWADDNTTETGYKPNCEQLLQRLIAFLSKYDPENPMLDSYGGCLANKHLNAIDENILKDPFLLNLVNVNRSCLMPTCNNPDAYKRKQDRKSCTTTICQAKIGVSDSQAGGAISVFGNQIQQNCGPESELSKSLEKGKESAKEIIDEKNKEAQQQIDEAKQELETKTQEVETAQAISNSENIINGLKLFFNNLFTSFLNLFKREGFQNSNFDFRFLNIFTQINYKKYLFFSFIFIVIPIVLLNIIK